MAPSRSLIIFIVFLPLLLHALSFPQSPDQRLTPGTYCSRPSSYRYRERIPYCNRQVSQQEKLQIINDYNKKLGYQILLQNRNQFKIDHLIPLCAGGSNDTKNLWPQHQSVYEQTDPVEQIACEKMAQGKLLQKRAVELIYRAKMNVQESSAIVELLSAM